MKQKITAGLIVIALIAGAVVIYEAKHNKAKPAIATQVQQKKNTPVQSKEQARSNDTTAQNVPVSDALSVNNISETQNKGVVSANAEIHGNKDISGSCVFTFENELSKPVVRQVSPKTEGALLSCNSGDIPEVEFSATGTWQLIVRYYDNGAQAVGSTSIGIK